MRKKVTKSDREFFNSQTKRKATSYSLVYMLGGSSEMIMDQKPYAMCKWKKNQIRHWNQYRTGNLNIVPNY